MDLWQKHESHQCLLRKGTAADQSSQGRQSSHHIIRNTARSLNELAALKQRIVPKNGHIVPPPMTLSQELSFLGDDYRFDYIRAITRFSQRYDRLPAFPRKNVDDMRFDAIHGSARVLKSMVCGGRKCEGPQSRTARQSAASVAVGWFLGGHFKTGQWWSPQNRPQDKCSGQGFLLLRDYVNQRNVSDCD